MRYTCSSLLLALTVSATAIAQDEACLGFSEGVSMAAARAPEVDAAEARLDAAQAGMSAARALRRPQVSTFGSAASGDNGLTSNRIENQVGVRLSQRVWDFGDSRYALDAASYQYDSVRSLVADEATTIAYRVGVAYLDWLEAQAMIEVTRERRAYFARQESAVEALLSEFGATRAERAQIVAQRAQAEADILELRFLADRAATRVRTFTGENRGFCSSAATGAEIDQALGGMDQLDHVVDAALSENPRIGARQSAIRQFEAQRDREDRNRYPIVDVVGIASYVYDDTREDWDTRDRVGIDVSVPILTGGSLDARRDSASARLSEEENAYRQLRRQLAEEAEVTFQRVMSLEAQLVRREAVEASQFEYFSAIEGEFDFGLGTLPVLVEARLDYEEAALDVVSGRFALLRERLNLMRLTARMPLDYHNSGSRMVQPEN